MLLVRRILQGLLAFVAFALYVWYAAVRRAPAVKRRKAQRRRARSQDPYVSEGGSTGTR